MHLGLSHTIVTDRFPGGARRPGLTPDEDARRAAGGVPRERMGTPEEFVRVAVSLGSERAAYVTGAARRIDGGPARAWV